jgi:hypothetical protein
MGDAIASAVAAARRDHPSVTVTMLLLAAVGRAAVEELGGGAARISLSCLVDLREQVASVLKRDVSAYPLLFGTVTIGMPLDAVTAPLAAVAAALKADIDARVARGEALRHAVALAAGDWGGGPPSATLELSSHGRYGPLVGAGWDACPALRRLRGAELARRRHRRGRRAAGDGQLLRLVGRAACQRHAGPRSDTDH